jgi:hypothetical protein
MKQIFDEDSAKDVLLEDKEYRKWLRNQENLILNMHNGERKRYLWNLLHKPFSYDLFRLTEEEFKEINANVY